MSRLIVAIAVAFLAPVTLVIGNALILSAVWKTPSRRVPYYITFLGGLALTIFFSGLISLPFYVATEFICLEEPQGILEKLLFLVPVKLIFASVGTYLSSATVLILTFMSLERYFHQASDRSEWYCNSLCNTPSTSSYCCITFASSFKRYSWHCSANLFCASVILFCHDVSCLL